MAAAALFRSKTRAALTLQEDFLRYLELEGDLSSLALRRKIEIPTARTVIKDSLADVSGLTPLLEQLRRELGGRFRAPVSIGFPSRDILIRTVEFPEMSLEDAREAMKWDFEKHFPYPYDDAAVDLARVEVPGEEPGKMSLMVAACRLRTIESFMRVADSAGMKLNAIEPINVALFRALAGPFPIWENAYLVLSGRSGVTQIILGYKESGILYRSSLLEFTTAEDGGTEYGVLFREIRNTLTFVRKQYHGLLVDALLVGGALGKDALLIEALGRETGLKCGAANPWNAWGVQWPDDDDAEWEPALGLAVRDIS